MRQVRLDFPGGGKKILGVIIVFFEPGRNSENIRVENYVFGRKVYLFG